MEDDAEGLVCPVPAVDLTDFMEREPWVQSEIAIFARISARHCLSWPQNIGARPQRGGTRVYPPHSTTFLVACGHHPCPIALKKKGAQQSSCSRPRHSRTSPQWAFALSHVSTADISKKKKKDRKVCIHEPSCGFGFDLEGDRGRPEKSRL